LRDLTHDDWLKIVEQTTSVYAANEVDTGAEYYHMPQSCLYASFF
jgi:hypothetical protein